MTTVRIFLALPCLPTLIVLARGGSASAQTAGSDIQVPPQPAESLLLLDDVVRESLEKKPGHKALCTLSTPSNGECRRQSRRPIRWCRSDGRAVWLRSAFSMPIRRPTEVSRFPNKFRIPAN